MKIKEDLMLRNIFGEYTVIPMGERLAEFTGMLQLNETGAFLWEKLTEDTDVDTLVNALTEEYDVTKELALETTKAFLDSLRSKNLLEE